jgi:fucose permease
VTSGQRLIAVAGILTFAFLGAIQALYGPLLPSLREAFGVDATRVGLVFTAHGLGALLGIFVPSLLHARRLAAHWLGIATALLLLGGVALCFAPTWPAMLAAALVLALGFGIHVVRLNSLFVAGFGARGMTMSLLINAAFSVGSILGPVILGLAGEPSRSIFGIVAIVALVLLPVSALTDRQAGLLGISSSARAADAAIGAKRSRTLLVAFVALMCLTTGVENSIGGWTTTLALAKGYSFPEAANLTALFFGGIFGGRLLAAAIGNRAQPGFVVVGAIACMVALLSIAAATAAGPVAFVLAGLAIAPIFSTTLVWVGAALPTSRNASAFVIGGALLGSALFPAMVGRVIAQFGATAAPPSILVLAFVSLAVALWIHFVRGR